MSTQYRVRDPQGLYFLTWTLTGWIDLFTRPIYKAVVMDSLRYSIENKGLRLHAYVIMSNHMHLIASAEDNTSLSDITRDIKKHTSKQFLKALNEGPESRAEWMIPIFAQSAELKSGYGSHHLWQTGSHAIQLYNPEWIRQKLDYIHDNPVRAGFVREAWQYPHSSAGDYQDLPGLLPLELL